MDVSPEKNARFWLVQRTASHTGWALFDVLGQLVDANYRYPPTDPGACIELSHANDPIRRVTWALAKKLEEKLHKQLEELEARLRTELNDALNERISQLRQELANRIEMIPFQLARDDHAYGVLKSKLLQDLDRIYEKKIT